MTHDAQRVQPEGWEGSDGSETQGHVGELEKSKRSPSHPSQVVTCHECSKQFLKEWNQIVRSRFHFCSKACRNKNNDCHRYAAEQSGNSQRFSGEGKSYVKLMGRHAHRVAAEEKLGRPLLKGEVVHHINGDRRDNRHENIQVMTQSEHIKIHLPEMLALKIRKNAQARGEGHGVSKLKCADIVLIRQLASDGIADTAIAKQFSVADETIRRIRRRKAWKHVL